MAIVNNDIGYTNDKGKVICNRSILLSVINLAAKEISGVSSLCDNVGVTNVVVYNCHVFS